MIIYVLKLENDKYYVGKSKNGYSLKKRIEYHKSSCGAAYTKLYKPVKDCLIKHYEIDESFNLSEFSEDNEVKLCMKRYGVDNVRGGSYSTTYLSPETIKCINRELYGASDCCFNCGDGGHWVRDCKQDKKNNLKDEVGKAADEDISLKDLVKITGKYLKSWF
jgi:hypothetical protein